MAKLIKIIKKVKYLIKLFNYIIIIYINYNINVNIIK